MASQAADDHLKRLDSLATARTEIESVWRQVQQVAAPEAGDFSGGTLGGTSNSMAGAPLQASAAKKSKHIYDATAVNSVDRLASGIEAIVMPQSDKWHGLALPDLLNDQPRDDERKFLERNRDLLFSVRYDADSGWVTSAQTCLRRVVAFGNSFQYVEEGWDRRAIIRYQYMPVNECYVAEDQYGQINAWYRIFELTGTQACEKYGDRTPPKIKMACDNPKEKDRRFRFVQCVFPSSEYGDSGYGLKKPPFRSLHIDFDSRTIVKEHGYYEFPIIDYRWLPEPGRIYGEGPVMRCLADIQSLQLMAKNEMLANQQSINPPLLVANAGVMNRPSTNPGAINLGGLNAQGQKMIEPMNFGTRLDFATMVLEAKRNQIKDSLYINLFSILTKNPQMTATEVLTRANEKGELLGPAGARLQQSLSRLIEREMNILVRRGLYRPDSKFYPPPSMRNRDIMPQFTSPIDRLRRAKEAEGTIRTLEIMSPLAQIDPSVVDNFEPDEMARGVGEILGMPARFLRDKDTVIKIRTQRQQQQQMAQAAAVAKDMATAGKQGSDAIAGIQQAGAL